MQTVYVLISDGGDGSATVEYFIDKELVNKLTGYDNPDIETYGMNESVEVLTFPDDFDLASCGIHVMTAADFDFDEE